jgi:hypothetical protein
LKITDAWGPPIGDSVARCHASIGHRGWHPPAASVGIKLPDLNSCPKLLPCPSASLFKPHRRLRVSATTAVFSLASHSAAVPKLRCQSIGAQRRAAVPLPVVAVVPAGPASRRLAPRAWLQLTTALTLSSVAVGGCAPPHGIELHQYARVVPAPSPPLLRLEHKPKVTTGGSKL